VERLARRRQRNGELQSRGRRRRHHRGRRRAAPHGQRDRRGGEVTPPAKVAAGVFKFATTGGNAITAADIGKNCFVLDDQTVVRAAGTTTRSSPASSTASIPTAASGSRSTANPFAQLRSSSMSATMIDRAKVEAAFVVFSTVFDMKLKNTPTIYPQIATVIPGVSERVEFKWLARSRR
jgi:hypothetical protein